MKESKRKDSNWRECIGMNAAAFYISICEQFLCMAFFMRYCANCGQQIEPGDAFCRNCGTRAEKDTDFTFSNEYEARRDISQNKMFAVLSYLFVLILIPILSSEDSKYLRFHINQGLSVCALWLVYLVIFPALRFIKIPRFVILPGEVFTYYSAPLGISVMSTLLIFCIFAFSAYGIFNAVTGKYKPLPVIGRLNLIRFIHKF